MSLPRLPQRILCLLGWHRWRVSRYWSINDNLVEGRVCVECRRTHSDRRVVER